MGRFGNKLFKKIGKTNLSSAMIKKIILVTFLVAITCGVGISIYYGAWDELIYFVSKEEQIEFDELAISYEQGLWGELDRSAADELVSKLRESSSGYYFEDVNYNDDSRAGWETKNHIIRLFTMIKNYGKDLIAMDDNVREYVIGTLDYWINNDFLSLNWWYNRISTPKYLSDIGIMLKTHLSEGRIDIMKKIIERGTFSCCQNNMDSTGANLLDIVDNTIRYSIFIDKAYLLKKAVVRTEKEIFISDGDTEGIKLDYTFYQHGAQQAIASYGVVYVTLITKLINFLDGTSFQLSDEKVDIFVNFILYGLRYAIRGNNSNYLVNGRSFSRLNGNNAISVKNSIGILFSLDDTPKKDELQDFYNSFDDLNYSLNETKYFAYSHTLFDISPDYYMVVKGAYKDFKNSELVNSENLLSRNLAYGGITTYQYTGSEYNEISALWDFSMLPGSTAYNETDEELKNYHGDSESFSYRSSTTHSSGASENKTGGLFVDIENEEGLFSRQAYISHNGLMVCLGNSLTNTNNQNTKNIFTTINQVYAENATYMGSEILGTNNINDNTAIYNGEFAYYNLEGDNLKVSVNNFTGNLNRNNIAANQEINGSIFKLYYSYGINPENQSFAYAVLANPKKNAPINGDGLPITRITNTNSIQAVEFTDGIAVIIFHEAGSFNTMSGDIISANESIVKIFNK